MFGRSRMLPTYDVTAKLHEASDLIKAASKLLDDACCGARSELANRIEAIPNLQHIDRGLADAVSALAAEIEAEDDAATQALEREFAATDAAYAAKRSADSIRLQNHQNERG